MSTIEFLPISGMGGTALPFMRRNQPTTTSTVAMNPQDKTRLIGYEERWRFYQGLHWGFTREDGDPLVTANIAKTIVNKLATWLVGAGMEITVSDALKDITLPVLKEVWKYNKQAALLLEMAIMGGVTGDVFTLITYEQPSSVEMAINPHTRGRIRLRLLGSHQVFPHWDPRNKERLIAVRIITEDADNRLPDVSPQVAPIPGTDYGGLRTRRYIETITADTITEHYEDEAPQTRSNILGEIPLVHWPNMLFPCEFYGVSDLDGIIDLQKELNQKLTDMSDIIHINAAPITIITGAKAKNLEKGPRGLWAFSNPLVKVSLLESAQNVSGIQAYITFIMQMIYDLSGVPEGSLGRIQPISNTAAASLQMQFQPLIEAIGRKAVSMEPALERVNYFILRYNQLINQVSYPIDICKNCGGRILAFPVKGSDGVTRIRKKCYIIDPQTLDFMDPEEVKVNIKRKFSFGVETRLMPFKRVKREFLKVGASYWDPQPEKDLQKEAEIKLEQAQKAQQEAQAQQNDQAEEEHSRALELKGGANAPK